MKRCKQLASSLAKEEEAQTQQVTPAVTCITIYPPPIPTRAGNGHLGNSYGNGNGRRRSWTRGWEQQERSTSTTLPGSERCLRNRERWDFEQTSKHAFGNYIFAHKRYCVIIKSKIFKKRLRREAKGGPPVEGGDGDTH